MITTQNQSENKAVNISAEEARAIAKEAYIYGFPIVDNYRVQYSYFIDSNNPEFKATWNQLYNNARVYTPDDKAIQTPNSDTPYSQLGTDLRAEPLVISVPEIDGNRYYSLQFVDSYTYNYAYIGSRVTGNKAGNYMLAGPAWKGEVPSGVKDIIRSETELGMVQYRTQLFNTNDIEEVKKVQAGYKVQKLSEFLGQPASSTAPKINFITPLTSEDQKKSVQFFNILNFILQFCPPHSSEKDLLFRFSKLGIGANGSFQEIISDMKIKAAVEKGIQDAWNEFSVFKKTEIDTGKRTAANGFGTREFLRNDYMARMSSAVLGIYGNSKEEALYPAYYVDSDGDKPDGSLHNYTITFPKGELPPVNSFWSITLYELPSSLLVANKINRFLINSTMLSDLKMEPNGALTLYLYADSPGIEMESNWLPAPKGPFWVVLRLYWPKEKALNEEWKAPPLKKQP